MVDPLHAVPDCQNLWGHEQCPIDHGIRDVELERVTDGTIMGCLVRLVAGYEPDSHEFSRTRYSYQLFNGLELGWAHAAGGNAAEVITRIATELPELAAWAWGDQQAQQLRDLGYAEQVVAQVAGMDVQTSGLNWLLAGWHAIAGRGDVGNVYTEWWYGDKVAPVVEWMQENDLQQLRTLAAGVRMRNSSNTWFGRLVDHVAANGEEAGTSIAIDEYSEAKGPERAARIAWPCFEGDVNGDWPSTAQLAWSSDASPERPDAFPPLPAFDPRVGQAPAVKGVGRLARLGQYIRKYPWVTAGILAGSGLLVGGVIWASRKKKPKRRPKRRKRG